MVSLAELRRSRGLTQQDLAILAGTTDAFIALVETQRRRFGPETRARLIRGLSLSPTATARVAELAEERAVR